MSGSIPNELRLPVQDELCQAKPASVSSMKGISMAKRRPKQQVSPDVEDPYIFQEEEEVLDKLEDVGISPDAIWKPERYGEIVGIVRSLCEEREVLKKKLSKPLLHVKEGYVEEKIFSAIKSIRDTCDRAEKSLLRAEGQAPENKIADVLHKFMWGMANAYTPLNNALLSLLREREERILSGKRSCPECGEAVHEDECKDRT